MSAKPHILVVDDDDRLRALLIRYLSGQDFSVSAAADAVEARRWLALFTFDLIVLDVMMPGESGLEFARSLPAASPPVLMLSARAEAEDRMAGLETGVDDYLTKPFEPKELLLRIRAILRRASREVPATSEVRFGPYRLDLNGGALEKDGESVYLTTAESSLLLSLAAQAGEAVSRETLAKALGQEGSERAVDVQVTRLRRKIEPEERPQYILTLRGAGYMLRGMRI